ncbi:MAG: PEGA domain-containing protein [Polyangiaceae bacterium]|nr:PEGA domain-containing protein [Polyangiaceae bacterium]
MLRRSLLPALLIAAAPLVVIAAAPRGAWADQRAPTQRERGEAARLKQQADAAMGKLQYGDALAAYSRAYELTGDPALLYNRGRALQGLGQFPEALDQLEAFDARAPASLKARVPALRELIEEIRGKVSTVSLSCNVAGARILAGDKVVGATPLAGPLKLNAGPTTLQIEAEGYRPFKKRVDLPGGKSVSIDAKLVTRSTTGVLVVQSPIAGARVTVDGRAVGNVPAELTLDAGSHQVVVERDGYEAATTPAVVAAGARKEVTVPLERAKPVVARWWFWAGVGAVVVGGAVLTGALLTEKPASRGDIDPGQVAAPITRF